MAIDALTPIVHPSNPVANLTIEQLSLIYQGKIRNWKEVGGTDLQIVVISRDTSSGTYESWQEKILHKEKVTPRAQLQASSGAVVQAVSKNRFAIGYVGIGYVNKSVKALTVNGIVANDKNALNGTYPIATAALLCTPTASPRGLLPATSTSLRAPRARRSSRRKASSRLSRSKDSQDKG